MSNHEHSMEHGVQPINSAGAYDAVIIVAGSRAYNDYDEFSVMLKSWLKKNQANLEGKSVVFISGKAKNGADNMIIRWCIEHNKPWIEMPADWDKHNKAAGMLRNIDMATVAARARVQGYLLVFWDNQSRGTRQMISTGYKKQLNVTVLIVKTESTEDGDNYGV